MSWAQEWRDTVVASLRELGAKVGAFVPNLLGMVVILVVGYLVSKSLQRLAALLLRRLGFDRATARVGLDGALGRASVKATASELVAKLVFWFFMLTFFISAAETLGLENVSRTIHSFVTYLPHVFGAAVVFVVGTLLAAFVRDLVRRGAEGMGLDYGEPLSKLVFGLVLVVVGSLAVKQLQVDTALVDRIVEIFLFATAAALALALGLGSRDLARNVLAGVYARDLYSPGTSLHVGEDRGRLIEVGTVCTTIETVRGQRAHVPNAVLTELVVHSSSDGD